MNRISRRNFLKRSISTTAGSCLALSSYHGFMPSVRGANNEVRVAVAGIRGRTLIINLPGRTKVVKESLDTILNVLEHAVDMLSGAGH